MIHATCGVCGEQVQMRVPEGTYCQCGKCYAACERLRAFLLGVQCETRNSKLARGAKYSDLLVHETNTHPKFRIPHVPLSAQKCGETTTEFYERVLRMAKQHC